MLVYLLRHAPLL